MALAIHLALQQISGLVTVARSSAAASSQPSGRIGTYPEPDIVQTQVVAFS